MNIKEISISELHPYENNPRNNDDAVDAVAKSIETFGFKAPLIIDKENVKRGAVTKAATDLAVSARRAVTERGRLN